VGCSTASTSSEENPSPTGAVVEGKELGGWCLFELGEDFAWKKDWMEGNCGAIAAGDAEERRGEGGGDD
jgi:hypothetical protein